jgi:hypothetical protein
VPRYWIAATLAALFLAKASTASADEPASSAETTSEAEEPARPHFGFELAAGVPDGFSLSILARPWTFLELRAGAAYNVVSFGVQGGITLAPIDFIFRPVLTLDAGHFFPGDANKVAQMISGDGELSSPLLEQVSYTWASAQLGIDIGVDQFRFFLRGGISYIRAPLAREAFATSDGEVSVTVGKDPILTGFVPCAKLGFTSILF